MSIRRTSKNAARCHPQHPDAGRGLCPSCYGHARRNGTLIDHPRQTRDLHAFADDYRLLAREGHTTRQIAERLGVTQRAVQMQLRRARDRRLL